MSLNLKLCAIVSFSCLALGRVLCAGEIDQFKRLHEEVSAHASCAAYVSYTFENFNSAGFDNEKEATEIGRTHFLLALDLAEELTELLLNLEIDNFQLIKKVKELYCMQDNFCFSNTSQIAGTFASGSFKGATDEVMRKEIECPAGLWGPCHGPEEPTKWGSKAAQLYKVKNCRLLIR